MGAGKEEDGRQAEQGEVHAHILATDQGRNAVHHGGDARHNNSQRHPAIGGIAAVIDPLGLSRRGQLRRLLRVLLQQLLGLLQCLPGGLRLRRQLFEIALGLPLGLLPQAALRLHTVAGDIRADPCHVGQQKVHVLLVLEVALLLLPSSSSTTR